VNLRHLRFMAALFATALLGFAADPLLPDTSAPPTLPGMKLVWDEEFDISGKPDPAVWSYEQGFVRNQELQWYQSDNANVGGGELVIEGVKQQVANPNYSAGSSDWKLNRQYAQYTSASITTSGHKTWQYGHAVVRARIDAQPGTWPAIWTVGSTGEWPTGGEVDLMEFYPMGGAPTLHANVAWGSATEWVANWSSQTRTLASFIAKDPDWVKKFHIWTMDWNKDTVRLSLDSTVMNTTPTSKTVNSDGTDPFKDRSEYIILNLAIGANGGDPSGATFPMKYEVDYVRVYQPTSTGILERADREPVIRQIPGSHLIAVQVPLGDRGDRLDLFSLLGDRILSRIADGGVVQIDPGALAPGIYLARLSTPRGAQTAKILR